MPTCATPTSTTSAGKTSPIFPPPISTASATHPRASPNGRSATAPSRNRATTRLMASLRHTWYEFFSGGGMARLGLGPDWRCLFSNDLSPKKAAAYRAYFGSDHLHVGDVASLTPADLPGHATLAWASFPCQDLSLAGNGAGFEGARSGSFLPFWSLMRQLAAESRAPRIVVLENVTGALTARGGADFTTLVQLLADAGYQAGCLVIDAARFLPQSRPRLFVVAVSGRAPAHLIQSGPSGAWHPAGLRAAHTRLPEPLRERSLWWKLPEPTQPVPALTAL